MALLDQTPKLGDLGLEVLDCLSCPLLFLMRGLTQGEVDVLEVDVVQKNQICSLHTSPTLLAQGWHEQMNAASV